MSGFIKLLINFLVYIQIKKELKLAITHSCICSFGILALNMKFALTFFSLNSSIPYKKILLNSSTEMKHIIY